MAATKRVTSAITAATSGAAASARKAARGVDDEVDAGIRQHLAPGGRLAAAVPGDDPVLFDQLGDGRVGGDANHAGHLRLHSPDWEETWPEIETGNVSLYLVDPLRMGREFAPHTAPPALRVSDVAEGNALMLHRRYAP